MQRGRTHKWPVAETWRTAVEVTAQTYGLDPEELRRESRGRGPRPPEHTWEAKKMAIHVTVLVADCSYAELARRIGFHKDTVCSHCAEMRDRVLMDDAMEAKSSAVEQMVRFRLLNLARQRVDVVRAQLALLEAATAELGEVHALGASSVDQPSFHPTISVSSRNRDQREEEAA